MKKENKKQHKFANKIAEVFRSFGIKHSERLIKIKKISLIPVGMFFIVASFLPNILAIIAPWIFCLLATSTIMERYNNYGAKICDKIANKIEEKCKISDQLDVYKELALEKIEDQKQEVSRANIMAISAELAADENMIGQESFDAAQNDRTKAKQMLKDMIKLYKKHKKSISQGELLDLNTKDDSLSEDGKIEQMLDEYNNLIN